MFKTKYAAVCEHIAPTPAMCEQVLAAMHAEEAAHIPTIVPIKKNTPAARFWMPIVACAAVALIAVTLGLILREGDPLPVAPISPTTTTVPTTSTTEETPSTTVADELIASTVDTTTTAQSSTNNVVTSTTPTTKAPSSTEGTAPSASSVPVLTPETYPSAAVSDYYALYQAIASMNTTAPTGNTTISSTANTPADSTVPSSAVAGNTTTVLLAPTTANATTGLSESTTLKCCTTTMAPAPSLPQLGEETVEEDRVDPVVQTTDRLIGHLKGNTVQLAPLDSGNASVLSSTKLSAPSGTRVRGFYLYNNRMAVIYAPNRNVAEPVTYVQLFDITNPAAPRQVHTLGQSGEFLGAHTAGGALYISTYHTPTGTPDPNDPATFVPLLYKNGAASVMPVHGITIAENASYKGYTVVTATALTGVDTFLSTAALFGQQTSHTFHCESGVVVLSDEVTIGVKTYPADSSEELKEAIFQKGAYATLFSCQNGRASVAETLKLQGSPDLPVVFQEHNGRYYLFLGNVHFREHYRNGEVFSSWRSYDMYGLYVLDAQFRVVKYVPNLWNAKANTPSIHFEENTLFIIASTKTHSIDLSKSHFPVHLIEFSHNLGVTAVELIDSEHLLTVSRGRYAKNDPFALTIRDMQWNVLYELIPEGTTSPLFAPRDGFILYADRICTYDADGIYELPIRFQDGESLVDCFATERTLYLVREDGITAYDRRNNYSLIGTF